MSNTIHFKNMTRRCNNGCLDVLLTVIGLSGSNIARTDCERNLIGCCIKLTDFLSTATFKTSHNEFFLCTSIPQQLS